MAKSHLSLLGALYTQRLLIHHYVEALRQYYENRININLASPQIKFHIRSTILGT